MKPTYSVVVGNIGTVITTKNAQEAVDKFLTYCDLAALRSGRAAGEDVTLFRDEQISREHWGWRGDKRCISCDHLLEDDECPECEQI